MALVQPVGTVSAQRGSFDADVGASAWIAVMGPDTPSFPGLIIPPTPAGRTLRVYVMHAAAGVSVDRIQVDSVESGPVFIGTDEVQLYHQWVPYGVFAPSVDHELDIPMYALKISFFGFMHFHYGWMQGWYYWLSPDDTPDTSGLVPDYPPDFPWPPGYEWPPDAGPVPPGTPDYDPLAKGIDFSFTEEVHQQPEWTRVDDPGGI